MLNMLWLYFKAICWIKKY